MALNANARYHLAPIHENESALCFVVIDSAGQKLAYVYYEEETGRRSAAKLLTKDEARRIAYRQAAGELVR